MKAASTSTILTLMLLPSTTTFARLLKGTKKDRDESITTSKDPTTTNTIIQRKTQFSTETTINNQPSPEELCSAFMIYDFLTRKMEREQPNDRANIDWSSACPPLQDLNPQLCPSGQYLVDICTEPYKVDLNPSVNYEYCQPLLAEIDNNDDFLDCVRACVRYVSRDRGDCCQFVCP